MEDGIPLSVQRDVVPRYLSYRALERRLMKSRYKDGLYMHNLHKVHKHKQISNAFITMT